MTRGRRGEATYTGYNGAREVSLRALEKIKKSDASLQYRKHSDSPEVMRACIRLGVCPFCGDDFKNLAAHTNRTHGIDKFELKKMAGIPKTNPACSQEFSESRSAAAILAFDLTERRDLMRRMRDSQHGKKRKYSEAGRAVQLAKLGRITRVPLQQTKTPEELAEYARRAGRTNSFRRLAKVVGRDAEIVRRIQSGELLRDISDDLGIHTRTAKKALERAGVSVDLRGPAAHHETRREKSKSSLKNAQKVREVNLDKVRIQRQARWEELGRTWSGLAVLADEWGVTEKTVVAYLKKVGESVPDGRQASHRRRAPKEAGPRLRRYAELGKDWNAILVMSQELGLRPAGLSQYLRNLGEPVPDGRSFAAGGR